ncbi:MAG TPA: GreA/GreB family elongation factor [Novosphingobium sp.]|jgi:transcription elongation GreA/GreB family factor|nr:GreA/GreB family elongation factor [Novosphingobium sp.]HPB23030.1 GreA/GreB family elongation factor [Novosphingobium sp.]HPZ47716.1 GreA/GreB family elongation factor [Novosphingobium sp.]HQE00814.1 GreA/GreB family elongation factor [Novosphingobium sp.]HQN54743.1 GreA/GreB family elongation factor [Novosphingobium sp.]
MSVAFRRDGDEEHLEPKFEIPIPPGPNRVTARGLALIGERIVGIEAQLAAAADEAEITALKRDLRYWQTRQITAELMPVPSGEAVEFGVTVTLRLNGKQRALTLVGDDEADPASGLIAWTAPLARALSGAEVGDVLDFGGRDEAIEVLGIAVPH